MRNGLVETKMTITRQTGATVLKGEAWCHTFTPDVNPEGAAEGSEQT